MVLTIITMRGLSITVTQFGHRSNLRRNVKSGVAHMRPTLHRAEWLEPPSPPADERSHVRRAVERWKSGTQPLATLASTASAKRSSGRSHDPWEAAAAQRTGRRWRRRTSCRTGRDLAPPIRGRRWCTARTDCRPTRRARQPGPISAGVTFAPAALLPSLAALLPRPGARLPVRG